MVMFKQDRATVGTDPSGLDGILQADSGGRLVGSGVIQGLYSLLLIPFLLQFALKR